VIVDGLWNAKDIKTSVDVRLVLGAVVFIALIGFIARMNKATHDIIVLMLVAMWLLFIMFNGLPLLQAFFNWFNQQSGIPGVGTESQPGIKESFPHYQTNTTGTRGVGTSSTPGTKESVPTYFNRNTILGV